MRILALIPARGGSKRIPNKNKRLLGGKPLIDWSIEIAKGIPKICDILVSTDDPEIAEVSLAAGALVPWLRPALLATDTASSVDVALHALDWYVNEHGKVDGLLLLQPTSPFRRKNTILKGINLFFQNNQQAVIGVSTVHAHPMWCFHIENERLHPFFNQHDYSIRSQDLPKAYSLNGGFYLISPTDLVRNRGFFSDRAVPLVFQDPVESLDIDTEFDWMCAEACVGKGFHDS